MSNITPQIDPEWLEILRSEFESPYFRTLKQFLVNEKQHYKVFPKGKNIFRAFDTTSFSDVKVVILGQDPYHGLGQADGLCFSVPEGITKPPSLVNIFKEIQTDIGIPVPQSGDLTRWAKQGVLLLNAILTVRENSPASHHKQGWETFTNKAIQELSQRKNGLVFLLWGNYAKEKEILIDTNKHFVLKAAHPSPFSAYNGFFGCRHFSRTQELLTQQGLTTIDW